MKACWRGDSALVVEFEISGFLHGDKPMIGCSTVCRSEGLAALPTIT
jgi:hypothetical protein